MASVIPAYGCLGFITQGKTRFGGLTTPEEMFVLAAYFGELGSVDQFEYSLNVELHRFGIWCLSRLCESVLRRVAASGRGSEVVRVIFHNRQGKLDLLFLIFEHLVMTLDIHKSSSFIGPLVVGLISDITGNIRFSFFFLVFMIWAALPILVNIDTDKGWQDAQEYRH